jgi:hypothetical protein
MTLRVIADLLEPDDYPVYVEKKMDGVHAIVWKVDKKILILSDDGTDITARFPNTCKRLLRLPQSYCLDVEIEMWKGDVHQPREYVAGYLGAKGRLEQEEEAVFNFFGLLWLNGRDLHNETEETRKKLLARFSFDQSTDMVPKRPYKLNLIPYYIANSDREFYQQAERVLKTPFAEGVVVKKSKAIYYLDTNAREGWIKWHVNTLIRAIVIEPIETKVEGVWNYRVGIDPQDYPVAPGSVSEVAGKEYLEFATTFSTTKKFPRGTVISVEPETVNLEYDERKGTIRLTTWVTRVIEETTGPDNLETVVKNARRDRCLQVKVRTEEEVQYLTPDKADDVLRRARKREKELAKVDWRKVTREWLHKAFRAEDTMKRLLTLPDGFTIFQFHARGRSIHIDLRRKVGDLAEGVTLPSQKAGAIKEEIDTIEEIRRLSQPEEIKRWSKFHPDITSRTKIYALGKAGRMFGKIPLTWLAIAKEVFPPGSVGATRFEEGVFYIPDGWLGMSYLGCTKPYYFELFLDMPAFPRWRLVFRYLKVRPQWAKTFPKEVAVFLAFKTDVETPYIISRRNLVEKKWLPEDDSHSALPPWWEEKIRPEEKWWGLKLKPSEKMKRLLAVHNRLVAKRKLELAATTTTFTLRRHFWRGAKVIRAAFVEHFDLLLKRPNFIEEWNLEKNPLFNDKVPGIRKECREKTPDGKENAEWMSFEGSIPPKGLEVFKVKVLRQLPVTEEERHWGSRKFQVQLDAKTVETKPTFAEFKIGQTAWLDSRGQLHTGYRSIGNPNKAIPAYMQILDTGKVQIISDTEHFLKFDFKGKKLKGQWVMKRTDPESDVWLFQKSAAPGEPLEGR